MNTNTLDIRSLTYGYNNQILFEDIHYQLTNGDLLLVTGSNGSGKSTLLRLLTGLMPPMKGDINWNHQSIHQYDSYGQYIHYISHVNGLKSALTVNENIQLMLALQLTSRSTNIANILKQFSLDTISHVPLQQLSAGQQRRVALAKLMLIKKPLWILDEPFTSLDVSMQQFLQEIMNDHLQNGGMIVISSHHELEHLKQITYHLKMSV